MTKHCVETDKELEAVLGAHKTRIHIIGAGGAGNNTISRLLEVGIKGVEAIAINTDAQDLLFATADHKVLIGKDITNGLGAGSDPKIGEDSARENAAEIEAMIANSDLVFITCGLGGGTGTGSAPIIAEIAKRSGALTIAVVTLPFTEEGIIRWENAQKGLEQLRSKVDTVIVVQNDRLLEMVPDMPLGAAFKVADEILVNAVKGITELVTEKGLVNLDFADVRTIMQNGGMAMIGLGESDGDSPPEDVAKVAAEKALQNPLLDVDITGARSALINITGGQEMSLKSARTVMQVVSQRLDPSAKIIWGARLDESLKDSIRVMLIATCLQTTKRSAVEIDMAIKKQEVAQVGGASQDNQTETIAPAREVEAPASVEKATTETTSRKQGGRVFSEIFLEETRADLYVLEEAVRGLAVGNRSGNERYLREIKNAVASINSSAELFSYQSIAELMSPMATIVEKAVQGEFDLSEGVIELFRLLPSTVSGLTNEDEKSKSTAAELKRKVSGILQLFDASGSNNKSKSSRRRETGLPLSTADAVSSASVPYDNKTRLRGEEAQPADVVSAVAERSLSDNGSSEFSNVDEAVKYINKLF
ncbi:MAG: cell division protein FtsZ [bacterium]